MKRITVKEITDTGPEWVDQDLRSNYILCYFDHGEPILNQEIYLPVGTDLNAVEIEVNQDVRVVS